MKENIGKKEKENCSGCGLCMLICPKHAISMEKDNHGFSYPKIDKTLCVNCGLCSKLCAFESENKDSCEGAENKVYAARLKNENKRMVSRSGGVFYSLAENFVSTGNVYGCVIDQKDFTAKHSCATTVDELERMQGAKYVQSDAFEVFPQILDDLQAGKKVLFSGTPCQTRALKLYLDHSHVDQTGLLLIDLVCHGVPGEAVWKDYLQQRRKEHGEIASVNFRDKSFGWNVHKESIVFKNDQRVSDDIYARMFWEDLLLRPSCFKCPFHKNNRSADITLGDYWGGEKEHSELCDNSGLSLCIARTSKGAQAFEDIKTDLEWEESHTTAYLQKNLLEATKQNEKYNKFWNDYDTKGYSYIERTYGKVSFSEKVKNKIRRIIHAK